MKKLKLDSIDLSSAQKEKRFFRLELFSLADGSTISLPAAIVGNGQGKITTVIAGQHGNEWNGPYAAHLLYQLLNPDNIVGKVLVVPIANTPAFLQKQRVSSLDNIDMNRTYAFVKKRKPTEHLAKILFESFCMNSDYVIDLHSGGPGEYTPITEVLNAEDIKLAQSLNQGRVIIRKKDSNSLVPNCYKAGIKAFSIEAGKALKLNYEYASGIANGIVNFLKTVGIVKEEPVTDFNQPVYRGKVTLPAEISGFFKSSIMLGQKVSEGQELCTIWPFFQPKPVKVLSPVGGTIIYLRAEEVVSEGDSIAHIAE